MTANKPPRGPSALVLLALALPLLGFKYIDPLRKWNEADMPIRWYCGEASPSGLTLDEVHDLLTMAHQAWADVPCSPLRFEYGGDIENAPTFNRPDRTQITFNGSLGSGVLAACVTHSNDEFLTSNGQSFREISSYNVIFGSGLQWATPERVASPQCHGEYSFLGVATHELGHGMGLGHSCDNGEACADPVLRAATMYWAADDCDAAQEDLNEDDAAGINAIYGAAVDFDLLDPEGAPLLPGAAPLDGVVVVPEAYRSRFDGFSVNFGDGSEQAELGNPDPLLDGLPHTWQAEGQYTVTLTGWGDDPACGGEFEARRRKVGAALACEVPQPSASWVNDGDFVVRMVNTTPLGAFGCTTEYEWTLDGDEDGALLAYEPTYEFEEAGTHTVALRAAGPAGEETVEVEIEARRQPDGGCEASMAGAGIPGAAVLLVGLAGAAWRRRRYLAAS